MIRAISGTAATPDPTTAAVVSTGGGMAAGRNSKSFFNSPDTEALAAILHRILADDEVRKFGN